MFDPKLYKPPVARPAQILQLANYNKRTWYMCV